jgi:hypothetical protein
VFQSSRDDDDHSSRCTATIDTYLNVDSMSEAAEGVERLVKEHKAAPNLVWNSWIDVANLPAAGCPIPLLLCL